MQVTDNTLLITGGGSGIGRGLAEAFHQLGNQVVIAGRTQEKLDETLRANPGMEALTLDITGPTDIHRFATEVMERFPTLNVLINNAGIMSLEDVTGARVETAERTIATNLLGPIRLTGALLPHLLDQPRAAVVNVSSGLAFVPMATTPTYCATKAAIHSYTVSLREQLKDTSVEVLELVPPYVQTELMGEHQATDPNALPLDDYISETMEILTQQPETKEVLVERVEALRYAEAQGSFDDVFAYLGQMALERAASGDG